MREAIGRADRGNGVVVLGDLGSSILTVRHLLERAGGNGHVRLVGRAAGRGRAGRRRGGVGRRRARRVVQAAEEARDARKL